MQSVILAVLLSQPGPKTHFIEGDLASAVAKLQAPGGACEALPRCAIHIHPGVYDVDTIEFKKTVDVTAYGASIRTRPDRDGVIFRHSAAHSTWRGGFLLGRMKSKTKIRAGMLVETRVNVYDVHIQSFARGLQLGPRGVPSEGTFVGLMVSSNKLDGVYTKGANSNANRFLGVKSFVNCRSASSYVGVPNYDNPKKGGKCANFHDASFLGNSYFGPSSHHALDIENGKPQIRYFQFLTTGSSNVSSFFDAYAEEGVDDGSNGNGPSVLASPALSLGGINNMRPISASTGIVIANRGELNRLMLNSKGDGDGNGSRLQLGNFDDTSSAISVSSPQTPGANLKLRPVQKSQWWEVEAGAPTHDSMGRLWMGKDIPGGLQRGAYVPAGPVFLGRCQKDTEPPTPLAKVGKKRVGVQAIDGHVALCVLRK